MLDYLEVFWYNELAKVVYDKILFFFLMCHSCTELKKTIAKKYLTIPTRYDTIKSHKRQSPQNTSHTYKVCKGTHQKTFSLCPQVQKQIVDAERSEAQNAIANTSLSTSRIASERGT